MPTFAYIHGLLYYCRALSAYAYLGAHNLYVDETGRLIILTQARFTNL
jgi:hypothetical protein